MEQNDFSVYSPPSEDWPYLAAMRFPDGRITIVPYDTAEEAEQHNRNLWLKLYGTDGG
jgi:hypothetical protein